MSLKNTNGKLLDAILDLLFAATWCVELLGDILGLTPVAAFFTGRQSGFTLYCSVVRLTLRRHFEYYLLPHDLACWISDVYVYNT
jgi:hypothetical protein